MDAYIIAISVLSRIDVADQISRVTSKPDNTTGTRFLRRGIARASVTPRPASPSKAKRSDANMAPSVDAERSCSTSCSRYPTTCSRRTSRSRKPVVPKKRRRYWRYELAVSDDTSESAARFEPSAKTLPRSDHHRGRSRPSFALGRLGSFAVRDARPSSSRHVRIECQACLLENGSIRRLRERESTQPE